MFLREPSLNTLGPYVCCDCRRKFKRPLSDGQLSPGIHETRPCPRCGKPAVLVGRKFKAPRASDKKQWEKVRLLLEHGFRFGSISVPYPASLSEAREWVVKWRHLSEVRRRRRGMHG